MQVWGIAPIFTVGTHHKLPSTADGQMQEESCGREYKISVLSIRERQGLSLTNSKSGFLVEDFNGCSC